MNDLNGQSLRLLMYFHAVVIAGSISRAAQRLGVSTPVVSTALSQLEAFMGATLINRTTRSMALTEIGEQVFEHTDAMMSAARKTFDLVHEQKRMPQGDVSLTLSQELVDGWLTPRLRGFCEAYPKVQLHIDAEDSIVALKGGPHEVAIRSHFSIRHRKLRTVAESVPVLLVCHRAYRHLVTDDWQDTFRHIPFISVNPAARRTKLSAIEKVSGERQSVQVANELSVSAHLAAKALCLGGLGVAKLLEPTVSSDIDTGELIVLGNGKWSFGFAELTLVMRDTNPSPAARAVVDHIMLRNE